VSFLRRREYTDKHVWIKRQAVVIRGGNNRLYHRGGGARAEGGGGRALSPSTSACGGNWIRGGACRVDGARPARVCARPEPPRLRAAGRHTKPPTGQEPEVCQGIYRPDNARPNPRACRRLLVALLWPRRSTRNARRQRWKKGTDEINAVKTYKHPAEVRRETAREAAFPASRLARLKRTIGSLAYGQEYLLVPIALDERIFKEEDVKGYHPEELAGLRFNYVFSWTDPSVKHEEKHCYKATVCAGITGNPRPLVIRPSHALYAGRGLSPRAAIPCRHPPAPSPLRKTPPFLRRNESFLRRNGPFLRKNEPFGGKNEAFGRPSGAVLRTYATALQSVNGGLSTKRHS
jgi:hypothetical protein